MLRAGVIGCGGHGLDHIVHARATGFVVSALCDPNEDAIAEARRVIGRRVPNCTPPELVGREDVDVVFITSPDAYHAEQLELAVAAGKGVMVDKPLAIDLVGLESARKAMHEAEKKNLTVLSCHARRFDSPYQWVKRSLPKLEAAHGSLQHIGLDFSYHKPSKAWKDDRSLLLDHFPHEIDFLRWICGDLPFVATALLDSSKRYTVCGRITNGVTFLCQGTRLLESELYPEMIQLRFARANYTVYTKSGLVQWYSHEKSDTDSALDDTTIPPTDYDARLVGTMASLNRIFSGIEALPANVFINTEAAVLLVENGTYTYSGRY